MDRYELLIHEMSELIDVPLTLGDRGQVVLEVDGVLSLHIERLIASEKIRVAALLFTLPPDSVRERVLKSALQANDASYPLFGQFAFSSKRSALVIFEQMRIEDVTGESLCDFLEKFILKAKLWHTALTSGRTEPEGFHDVKRGNAGGASGLFGLS